MSLSTPKQKRLNIGLLPKSLLNTLEQRKRNIGIVVDIQDENYLVFNKDYPKYVKTFIKREVVIKVGDVVEITNSSSIAAVTLNNIGYDWNGHLNSSSPGKLSFTLKDIALDKKLLSEDGFFVNELLGKIEDAEKVLEYTAYRTIVVMRNHPNSKYFWKVAKCDKIDEKTVEWFIVMKTAGLISPLQANPTTESLQSLLEQSLEAPLPEEVEDEENDNYFEDSEEFKKANEELKMRQNNQNGQHDPQLLDNGRNLHIDQEKAIRKGLNDNCKILLIDGGAGTGKTKCLVELVCELVLLGNQVLVLALTVANKNNIMQALKSAFFQRKLKYDRELVVVAQIDEDLVENSQNNRHFCPKTVIVDEAHQFSEKQVLPKVKKFHRLILAGESKQLHRVSKGKHFKVDSVLNTFRDKKMYSYHITLRTQFRCPQEIGICCSRVFYKERIETDWTVANNSLMNLPDLDVDRNALKLFSPLEEQFRSLVLCNTGKEKNKHRIIELYETRNEDGMINKGEATIILQHIRNLMEIGVHPANVAVITPFTSQKLLLRTMLSEAFTGGVRIEVETADAYQGQGKNIVLVSLVRNNPLAYGFEDMAQFVKFAMTRAMHHTLIVANPFMFKNEVFVNLYRELKNSSIASIVEPSVIRGEDEEDVETEGENFEYFGLFSEQCSDESMKSILDREVEFPKSSPSHVIFTKYYEHNFL